MKTKIRKYCFPQYFWLIIWTIPKNVNFDQKTAVRGAISQKEGIEILQDAPHIKAFWIPDQVVSSALMEMKVTLEEGCALFQIPVAISHQQQFIFYSWTKGLQRMTNLN